MKLGPVKLRVWGIGNRIKRIPGIILLADIGLLNLVGGKINFK